MNETKQESKPTEELAAKDSAGTSVPEGTQHISVKLEGVAELEQAIGKMTALVTEAAKSKPEPKAILSNTEASQSVEDAVVKDHKRLERIAAYLRANFGNVKEDISSTAASGALGQIWSPDMIVIPTDLPANLRRFVQVKEIPKGSKQVNFTTINTPAFASLTEDTSSGDVSQSISEISVGPTETGAKQRVSYITMESATPDVVQAVERSFQAAALIDEDAQILTALDGASASDAGTVYAGTATSEATLTSSMTFAGALLAQAMTLIQQKGYALNPGDLVACVHAVQYDALLQDSHINQYLYFGSAGPIQQGVVPQVYGVDIVRSTKVPTGTGSGSPVPTTYHAQVFLKAGYKGNASGQGIGGAVALAISRDLLIELWRRPDERDLWIVASHRIAAGILQPYAAARILSC
jgi:hypothetical protein